MKYRFKIVIVVVFIILSLLTVGKSRGQQQRTAGSAETALQTFFTELTGERKCHLIAKFIFPDEGWQQNREASYGSFLLLPLSLFVITYLMIFYMIIKKYQNQLSCKNEIIFNR